MRRRGSVTLVPLTLTDGLCNQIFALIGYVLLAKKRSVTLAFPNFVTHEKGGGEVPLEALFDPEPLVASLRTIGVRAVTQRKAPNMVTSQWTGNPAVGWRPWAGGRLAGLLACWLAGWLAG